MREILLFAKAKSSKNFSKDSHFVRIFYLCCFNEYQIRVKAIQKMLESHDNIFFVSEWLFIKKRIKEYPRHATKCGGFIKKAHTKSTNKDLDFGF